MYWEEGHSSKRCCRVSNLSGGGGEEERGKERGGW